jgi:polyvinyl alcohol dehydrogenase (cytochrome)
VYVPMSSWEEFNAKSLDYPCCTSIGSVVALDAQSGKRIWQGYVFDEKPQPSRKNSKGVQLWGPAGGAVWNSPTIDEKRGALYVGTGDATTFPAHDGTDSVVAFDLKSGRKLWSHRVFEKDSFLVGCGPAQGRTENCPQVHGPDWDIPGPPILQTLANGKRTLIVGTKPGDVLALDPDNNGAQLWRVSLSGEPPIGADSPRIDFAAGKEPVKIGTMPDKRPGIIWGGAVDSSHVYYGVTTGGVAALRLDTGERSWFTPFTRAPGAGSASGAAGSPAMDPALAALNPSDTVINNGAPTSAIPGVVFVAGTDGVVRAVSASDGKPIWSYATARDFETVNKVPARGGSISSVGVTIANGMLFVPSGYAIIGSQYGNVLLAFAPE